MFEKIKYYFKELNIKLTFLQFILYFSIFNLIFYSYPLFKYFYLTYNSVLLLIPISVFVYLILVLLYSTIIFKKYFRIILFLIFILNSLVFYYMFVYGIVFDINILINIMGTNYKEASEFFSIKPFIFIFTFAILPFYFFYNFVNVSFNNYIKIKIKLIIIIIILILFVLGPNYLFKKSKIFLKNNQRITSYIIPINYIGAILEYTFFTLDTFWTSKNLIKISDDVENNRINKNNKKNLLVFMIGESARAKNFSINGYARETNKFLKKYKNNIISFKNFESCATFTAGSLTCTFSHFSRKDFKYSDSFKYESLIDIFNKLNFDIYWRSNNGQCKNICKRVHNSLVKSLGTTVYDDLLIKIFKTDINKLNKENNLIFLHGRGSHGPLYYKRYPKEFEIFKPACNDEMQNCNVQEILNAYDNTIHYTSYLIKEILDEMQKYENEYNIAFIYMSDHGQSLGEKGIFMHSYPFDSAPIDQKNPAFFMWFSNDFSNEFNIDIDCLKKESNKEISQDNIFHSMIGLFEIKSKYYNKNLNLFENCKLKK